MALTPDSTNDVTTIQDETTQTIAPSKTWAIDFENGTISGFIDDDVAIKQFALKALMTERSKYAIYTEDYGTELSTLIGADVTAALLASEIPRMIEEALIYDDRIDSVQDLTFTRDGDKLYVSFRIVTINGNEITTEGVAINGV
jgi:hypothetical protein